jgi:hypothetical protein
MLFDDPRAYALKIAAARMGCGQCGGALRIPPSGDPFTGGPWRGRYLCQDCWTLYYADHPEHLADPETVDFIQKEAEYIKVKRAVEGAEILFEEGDNRAYLTGRGTLVFRLENTPGQNADEYDPVRFQLLLRAIHAIDVKSVAGYSLSRESVD